MHLLCCILRRNAHVINSDDEEWLVKYNTHFWAKIMPIGTTMPRSTY